MTTLFARFHCDPHAIVRFSSGARPRDFGELAPLVVRAVAAGDPVAVALMQRAGRHADALAQGLIARGANRLALMGGLADKIKPWLAEATRRHLVAPRGDALDGALLIAAASAGLRFVDTPLPNLERHQ